MNKTIIVNGGKQEIDLQLRKEFDEILQVARHRHVNSGVTGDDRCKQCGLDLRHIIHRRA